MRLRKIKKVLVACLLVVFGGLSGCSQSTSPVATSSTRQVLSLEQQVQAVGIFREPLIAVGGHAPEEQSRSLLAAVEAYQRSTQKREPEDLSTLEAFLKQYPDSPWAPSLRLNCGLLYHQTGQYSKALASLQQAWKNLSDAKDLKAKAQADRALGELAVTWAYLGRYEELEPLLKQVRHRALSGSATELVTAAAEGLHDMNATPEKSFLCGPAALGRICLQKLSGNKKAIELVGKLRSTKKGTSLALLCRTAQQAGLSYQIAFREPGAAVLTPTVVHWKVGHFSCLEEGPNQHFRVEDPTYGAFGESLTMARSTLDAEASGYFLVPAGPLPSGWRAVSLTEGEKIWGRGDTGPSKDGRATTTCDIKGGTDCCGMATWAHHTMVVGLAISDIPVGTGPNPFSIPFQINYAQREVSQPGVFSYTNFGPKWTCNWLSYIETDGYRSRANLYEPGGGLETYPFFIPGDDPDTVRGPYSNSLLRRTIRPDYFCTYVRELPDGTKITYDHLDARTSIYTSQRVFMSKITDPQGNTTTINYDDQYRIQSITNATGKVTTLVYGLTEDPYKVTKVVDPYGRSAQFTYSPQGLLTSSTDTLGISSQFTYGAGDFIRALTTPYGTTTFAYGDASTDPNLGVTRWLTATDPNGRTSRVESTPLAQGIPLSESVVPAGMSVNNIYLYYRNTFVWTPEQLAGGVDYTKATVYHFQHVTTEHVETGLGQFYSGTSRIVESMKRPLERRVWYNYKKDVFGPAYEPRTNLVTAIGRVLGDGSTQLTRLDYNDQGNVISRIDPAGRSYAYQYAGNGVDLTSVTVNGQQLMAATYDDRHNIQTLTGANGGTSNFSYNALGLVASATNQLGQQTGYTYTNDGDLSGIQEPLNKLTTFTNDAIGRKISATDSEGYTVQAEFDNADRPVKATFPDGTTETLEYNLLDLAATTDRNGRRTTFQHDASRRLTQVLDAKGGSTVLGYGAWDKPLSLSDPGGRVTVFGYDIQGRISAKQYSAGGSESYTYLLCCGLPRSITDALGHSKSLSYNVDNTLKNVSYSSASTPAVSYTYDSLLPRILTMTDGTGQTTYSYGAFGGPGANQVTGLSGPYGDTASFSYDVAGRPLAQTVNGSAEDVTYDDLWRPTSTTNALDTFTMSYLGKTGQVTGVNSTSGPSAQYAYAPNAGDRRLTQIKNLGRAGDALSQFDYVYDPVGQITQITESLATSGGGGGGNTTGDTHTNGNGGQNGNGHQPGNNGYENGNGHTKPHTNNGKKKSFLFVWLPGLDPGTPGWIMVGCWGLLLGYGLSRPGVRRQLVTRVTCLGLIGSLALNGCIFTGNTASNVNVANFSYDNLGQLVGVDLNGTATERYQFDPSGNLTSLTTGNVTETFAANNLNQQTAPGTHVYDAKGQKTTLDGKTFEWDDQGRVTAIVQGTNRSEFAYDGMSRRTKITELTNGVVTSKKLYWWLGGTIVCERDGLQTGFPITKRYFGQGVLQGVTKLFYTMDHLGSVRELVDEAGVVQADYRYTTYGERTKQSGALDSDWGYAGLWHHGPSGLDLATYRAYDAANRRWISRDPLGEGVDYNLYRYCGNNPISNSDPSGLDWAGAGPSQARTQRLTSMLNQSSTFRNNFSADAAEVLRDNQVLYGKPNDGRMNGFGGTAGKIFLNPSRSDQELAGTLIHEILHKVYRKKKKPKIKGCPARDPNQVAEDTAVHSWIYMMQSRVVGDLVDSGMSSQGSEDLLELRDFDTTLNGGRLDNNYDYLLMFGDQAVRRGYHVAPGGE